ncbi:MAG: AAA family ATPase [Desulfovibrionaceae bacterium]|jgi:type II secretory pathway predicted ATPase ExeA|nr:AAA family ATPase [Desulfovibrionaceae bacterium]
MSSQILTALGLESNPFPAGACSVHYFHTSATKRILDEFLYALTSRKGFLVLIGEVGLGKTSLLLQLLGALGRENLATAWIFNTVLSKDEILQAVARDFGLDVPPGSNISATIDILHQFFLENHRAGKNCAIIIDEAHNLDLSTLEVLRMLSNLELEGNKLVQILLVGQPELKARLWQPELRQLRSRINIFEELPHLSREETGGYVNFKFKSAGSQHELEGKALDMVYTASLGNLRMINLIMEKALYAMVALNERGITLAVVREALKDITPCQVEIAERMQRHRFRCAMWRTAAALVAVVIVSVAALFAFSRTPPLDLLRPAQRAAPATAKPAAAALPPHAATPPAPAPTDKSTAATDSSPAPTAELAATLDAFLPPLGLEALRGPLVEAAHTGRFGGVTAALPAGWMCAGLETLPPGRGAAYQAMDWNSVTGTGPAYVAFWRPKLVLDDYYPDYKGPEIRTLQGYLKRFGLYRRSIDGSVGSGTWRAVHAFQVQHGLQATGAPDAATQLWLEALAAEK